MLLAGQPHQRLPHGLRHRRQLNFGPGRYYRQDGDPGFPRSGHRRSIKTS